MDSDSKLGDTESAGYAFFDIVLDNATRVRYNRFKLQGVEEEDPTTRRTENRQAVRADGRAVTVYGF